MPQLPAAYAWLSKEAAPRVLVEALALFRTKETPGAASNPAILGWAREVGVAEQGRAAFRAAQAEASATPAA